jgi:hypothetical protein
LPLRATGARRHLPEKTMNGRIATAASTIALALAMGIAAAQASDLSFFVTSTGSGKGADFGGLAGADQHCQALATAVGAGDKTWHAYLSAAAQGGSAAVNARDRIGKGPWKNAKGVVIAGDVAELHGSNNLTKQTALTEKGTVVNGRGDTPNEHDILTGTQPDGTAFAGADDKTCGNWTKSGDDGATVVGHADRTGLDTTPPALSWNSSHPTKGCSVAGLKSTGGAGYLYCFAAN